jgi:hypothetical protein
VGFGSLKWIYHIPYFLYVPKRISVPLGDDPNLEIVSADRSKFSVWFIRDLEGESPESAMDPHTINPSNSADFLSTPISVANLWN